MERCIEKVPVLGGGTMGARIAAHLANAGIACLLLNIIPPELNADEKAKWLTLESPAVRNRVVLAGLEAAKKSKPAAFFTPETSGLITSGNLEDNLAWCSQVDWIIEAVAENREIKRGLFERVEAVRKSSTIVTSNTCGLPIRLIAKGRSEDFQKHRAGTHFFNPPRYIWSEANTPVNKMPLLPASLRGSWPVAGSPRRRPFQSNTPSISSARPSSACAASAQLRSVSRTRSRPANPFATDNPARVVSPRASASEELFAHRRLIDIDSGNFFSDAVFLDRGNLHPNERVK